MENYELTFIISALIPETEHGEIKNKVLDYIKGIKGQISKEPVSLGRKKLAYAINKQKHGFYISLEFKAEEKGNLNDLDTKLKHNDNILRHLTIKKPFISEEEKKENKREIKKEAVKTKNDKPKEDKVEITKINLDDIDSKLDNLLD